MEPEERGRDPGERRGSRTPGDGSRSPLRLALALGDPERERSLLPALGESGDFAIAERCLAADQLLACLEGGRVDAALVAFGLHRLTASALGGMARTRVPIVVLAEPSEDESRQPFSGIVLSPEADPESVRQALMAAVRGERPGSIPARVKPEMPPPEPAKASQLPAGALSTISVASGHGGPGRTTVALNLAAALGAVAPTVLVDADLSGPSMAAYLDADPTRNLYMLAHAEPETPGDWGRAIEQETQPLSPRSPHGVVICGVPKAEMRAGVSARFFERLLAELRQRYRYVVVDVGADLLGSEASLHRTALGLAQQVLLVASGDLVGLWHARSALGLLKNTLQLGPDRVALVINRHDRRYHHGRTEIEWALGLPAAGVIPYDHGAAERALAAQTPLVMEGGRAGRALLELAERVHRGSILLPPEQASTGRARGARWIPALPLGWPGRNGARKAGEKGAAHGEHPAPAR